MLAAGGTSLRLRQRASPVVSTFSTEVAIPTASRLHSRAEQHSTRRAAVASDRRIHMRLMVPAMMTSRLPSGVSGRGCPFGRHSMVRLSIEEKFCRASKPVFSSVIYRKPAI